ncbi:hypothetical protein D9758_003955 [Tetrapyrgos nigripes]|uniref:Protein kinase domain-containing protein n=1 Tax=Tetrapyrgos nigripes TaxID=182062 RepID=A0A8H5LRQ3_9AGAR|nr:hypothetical protein D9758_003955 [Tetrapyrgos nigripes]
MPSISLKLLPFTLLLAGTLASTLVATHGDFEDAFQDSLGQCEQNATTTTPPSCLIREVEFSTSPQLFADTNQVCSGFPPLTFNITLDDANDDDSEPEGDDQCAREPAFDFSQWILAQNLNASSSSHPSQSVSGSSIVGGLYQIGKKIGQGSFGVVFEGSMLLSDIPVAIKFERNLESPKLVEEFNSYMALNGTLGVPQVYYFGQEGLHNVLVMDLLGPSLEDVFKMCGRKFSVKTVCMLAKQLLTRVEAVHEKSLLNRDIKPDNFLIGVQGADNVNTAYMIDFGLAKYYRDPETQVHIPYKEGKGHAGTARYMSINNHLGRTQSRRDDLETLGYVFMYFLRGRLPWQALRATTDKERYKKIRKMKQSTPIAKLFKGFPEEFSTYMNYVRHLGFEETPNYDYLRDLFTRVLQDLDEEEDGVYDWMLLNNGQGWEAGIIPSTKPKTLVPAHAIVNAVTLHASREHRPDSEDANNSSPLVLNPAPAHAKGSLNLPISPAAKWVMTS